MRPCKNCGGTERYTPAKGKTLGRCKVCARRIHLSKYPKCPKMECEICHRLISRKNKYGICSKTQECINERKRRWTAAHPEEVRERNMKNKEVHAQRQRKLRLEMPEKVKEWHRRGYLKATYDITMEQYELMLAAQEGKCAICKASEPGGRYKFFAIDHNHETGKIRGLLCLECNSCRVGCNTLETAKAVVEYLTNANTTA